MEENSEVTQNPSEVGNSGNVSNESLDRINQTINQLGQNQVALQQMLAQQMQMRNQPQEQPQEDHSYQSNDVDLESLSRRELVELIENRLVKAVGENLKPVTEKITSVEQSVNARTLQQQVDSAKMKYKDFENFSNEMLQLHNQPQFRALDVDSLYHIAKARFPEKAYKEPAPEPTPAPKQQFNGFFPTSAVNRSSEGKKSMDTKQAVEAAWNEIFGG